MNILTNESFLSGGIVLVLIVLANPFHFLMPETWAMWCTALVGLLFLLFVVALLRDQGGDEREMWHRFMAARVAYLVGTGILVLGIILQTLMHHLSWWLPLALGGMLVAKLFGHWFAQYRY